MVGLIHFKSGYSNDISSANIYLDELKRRYPDDEVTLDAEIYLNGDTEGIRFDKSGKNSTKQEQSGKYELLGNYPNPFNPTTTISYALKYQSSVEVVIYDIIGRVVKSVNISSQSAGYQSVVWDGKNEIGNSVASGIYLYRISIKSLENNETFVKTAKLMLMK